MAWTSPVDFSGGNVLEASELNAMQDNLRALKNPPYALWDLDHVTSYTTTSATFTPVSDVEGEGKHTLTVTGDPIMVGITMKASGGDGQLTVSVDGTDFFGGKPIMRIVSTDTDVHSGIYVLDGVSAGSRIFRLEWKITSSSVTLDNANYSLQFWVREMS